LATDAAAFAVVSRIAQAGTYPTRSVRMIVPFPAGNASDILARLVAQSLSERLGRPFIIENRPGAGGTIGTEVVVRAAPDGYALLMEVMTANAINATLYDKLNYDFIRDIAPVASIGRASCVMVVNPSLSAQIEAGLIRLKARKDHWRLAVRTERTLARRFSTKERGNGTIEHNTLRLLGGSATLSVTDRCRVGR
jgi:tripartite-type tricarboxylate transporter receptor subunit TctC